MPEAQLTRTSYLKYAFKDQHNLVLLFGAGCFSLAFATKTPLFVAASAELLWLVVGPRLPAFRGWVDSRITSEYLARAEAAIEVALGELSESDANRFRALSRNAAELLASARTRFAASEVQRAVHGLLELRRTFLDYLFLGQRVAALADTTSIADREREAAELQQSYRAERELTTRMTIRNSLSALQLRISQQTALGTVSRNVELHLEMLEAAVPYLSGRLADPAFELFGQEIDNALADLGPADTLEAKVDEIFEQAPTNAAR